MREELEQTISRFLKGLNPAILDKVELQHFWTVEDACKLAVKVEKQLMIRRAYPYAPTKPAILTRTFAPSDQTLTPRKKMTKGR